MAADPYLYPGTDVLRNTAGIRDFDSLAAYEYEMVASRAAEALRFAERSRHLGEKALQSIHRILFCDVYEWAGELRSIYLSKESSQFTDPDRLPGAINANVMPAFRKALGDGTQSARVTSAFAQCWGSLNRLHPFREGNGRAIQLFLMALARRHGRDIEWRKVSYEDEIAAAQALMTGDVRGYETLLAVALTSTGAAASSGQYWPAKPWATDED